MLLSTFLVLELFRLYVNHLCKFILHKIFSARTLKSYCDFDLAYEYVAASALVNSIYVLQIQKILIYATKF
jgi:hypothetical protein